MSLFKRNLILCFITYKSLHIIIDYTVTLQFCCFYYSGAENTSCAKVHCSESILFIWKQCSCKQYRLFVSSDYTTESKMCKLLLTAEGSILKLFECFLYRLLSSLFMLCLLFSRILSLSIPEEE